MHYSHLSSSFFSPLLADEDGACHEGKLVMKRQKLNEAKSLNVHKENSLQCPLPSTPADQECLTWNLTRVWNKIQLSLNYDIF